MAVVYTPNVLKRHLIREDGLLVKFDEGLATGFLESLYTSVRTIFQIEYGDESYPVNNRRRCWTLTAGLIDLDEIVHTVAAATALSNHDTRNTLYYLADCIAQFLERPHKPDDEIRFQGFGSFVTRDRVLYFTPTP